MSHLKRGEKPGSPTKPRVNKYGFEVVDIVCSANPKHTGEILLPEWERKQSKGEAIECHTHRNLPENLNRGCKKKDECFGTYSPMSAPKQKARRK